MITKTIKKWKTIFWPGPVCGCKFFINIEEKEEKREEDKVGKETRALHVPCGSETYGYSGANNR